jgi:SHS2 domain-containing protein
VEGDAEAMTPLGRSGGTVPERYRVLEHTADVMIEAAGRDLAECFANAAYALFDQMVDASTVEDKEQVSFEVESDDLEALFYNFLSEFLYLHDARRLVFSRFDVVLEAEKAICIAGGERYDPARHGGRRDVKAITYHMLEVDPSAPRVRVLFDI